MFGVLTIVLGVLLLLLFFWAVAAVELSARLGPQGQALLTRFGIVVVALFLLVAAYLTLLFFAGSP